MKEVFSNKEAVTKRFVEEFTDESMPYKVRKIRLIERLGLPVPMADIYPKNRMRDLVNRAIERLKKGDPLLIIRFACIPDKFSMPVFYVGSIANVAKVVAKVSEFMKNKEHIVDVILQSATPEKLVKDKISGRLIFYDDAQTNEEQILELYKGARSTGILNKASPKSVQLWRFIKLRGGILKPEWTPQHDASLKPTEVADIIEKLNNFMDLMQKAKDIFFETGRKKHQVASFEFAYQAGKLLFTDID